MPATRRRRIVRRATMALAGVVLVVGLAGAWLAMHKPPEIQRSRTLRMGMTEPEVTAVMGAAQVNYISSHGRDTTLVCLYGRSRWAIMNGLNRGCDWIGIQGPGVSTTGWPVTVHFHQRPDSCVFRIERGDEVEEASP